MGFFTQSLTIPTPIVFFISLIANRPNGGNSLNISRQIGLRGSRLTKQQSPFLTDLGWSSKWTPVLLSIFAIISVNLHATWEVWQSNTGLYPLWISFGWFKIII